jgi:hypothetical protein
MTETTRAWVYRGLLALVALAIVYGLVSQEQAAAWVGVVSAIAGNGLATLNTSTSKAP